MSRVLSVSRCPKCAERGRDKKANNLAEYENGYHCFSCGYNKPKCSLKRLETFPVPKVYNGIVCEKKLLPAHLKWLLGYGLTEKEMENFRYATKRIVKGYEIPCNLLVFINTGDYWLGRNFADVGVRYLSSGEKPLLKYGTNPDVVVFVEDVISAIKVGRVATAIPMLGAKIPADWLNMVKGFERVVIWGDYDKKIDNIYAARKASEVLGKPVQSVITEKDPKFYSTEEVYNYLQLT